MGLYLHGNLFLISNALNALVGISVTIKNSFCHLRHVFGVKHFKRNNMMNQFEVSACLADKLPEMKTTLKNTYATLNVFKAIQCLVNYTKQKLVQHDIPAVKNCLYVAEYIYSKGNKLVKNAIENVFIYSFSSLLNMGTSDEKKQLQSCMPLHLYTAYVHQVLKPGF